MQRPNYVLKPRDSQLSSHNVNQCSETCTEKKNERIFVSCIELSLIVPRKQVQPNTLYKYRGGYPSQNKSNLSASSLCVEICFCRPILVKIYLMKFNIPDTCVTIQNQRIAPLQQPKLGQPPCTVFVHSRCNCNECIAR